MYIPANSLTKCYFYFVRPALFSIFLLLTAFLHAQSLRFSHLDQKQGLSQNTATAFLQDHDGFIWVGTQDGLNRYDGYSFRVYRKISGDSLSLSDNFVLSLAEDTDGNIWVGTRNGVCVFLRSTQKFYRWFCDMEEGKEFHASYRQVTALRDSGVLLRNYHNALNRCYVTFTNGIAAFRSECLNKEIVTFSYSSSDNRVALSEDNQVTIFSLSATGDTVHYQWPELHPGHALLLHGNILYAGDTNVLYRMVIGDTISRTELLRSAGIFTTLATDDENNLWAGTSTEGVILIPTWRTEFGHEIMLKEDKSDFFSLVGNHVEALFKSREGLMWIGTVGCVNIYDPLQQRFEIVHSISPDENPNGPVWMIRCFGNTELWSGDKGLNINSRSKNILELFRQLPQDIAYSASGFDSQGRLWLGTKRHGIIIIDTVQKTVDKHFLHAPEFAGSTIMDLCAINGKMWIASIGTLMTIRESDFHLNVMAALKKCKYGITTSYFSALFPGDNGSMYVGSNQGVYHFDATDSNFVLLGNDPSTENSLAYNLVNDIYCTGDELWVATMGYGMDCYNKSKKQFTHYTTLNGLANNTIYCIQPDDAGHLWLTTNEGIVVFNPATGDSRNYTMRDGLPSNEFVVNRKGKNNSSGLLYFGSASGLVRVKPSEFTQQPSAARPVLSRLLVNYEERPFVNDSVLFLSPDERNISFDFTAIDFRNQDKITYEYRLEGFDTTWHSAGVAGRTAVFTNLPYGEYDFVVRYRISGNEWSPNELHYRVLIATPFYATWWFRLTMIFAGITIVAFTVRYISQRKLRKQLEEMRVHEQIRNEKERISRDLHDNVGAQLTYVISSLDSLSYALHRNPEPVKTSEKLESLGEFARGTMDQLRESIWAINSEHISLTDLAARWKQYMSQLSETHNDFSGSVKTEGPDLLLKPSVAIEVHRIVQEAITNAFKHSKGNRIAIEIDVENNRPSVTIEDNGVGMSDNPGKAGHYGLGNMKERAKRIDGDLSFESDKNGTTVHLFWKHN